MASQQRRYDLDWLRIIAFGLLIFYHMGMFYVTWGWHVKSAHAGPAAEHLMSLLNPWRLPLLFLISGVAVRFALDKASNKSIFARQRFVRLFVPLVFGMIVIVTPQTYYELLGKGEITPGYLEFWARYLSGEDSFSVTVPTWNHLWYVVYVLAYSLIAIPMITLVRRLATVWDTERFARIMGGGRLFILPAFLFIFYRFTTDMAFPDETHNFTNDWGAHVRYGSYFLIGMLIAKNTNFWRVLGDTWRLGSVMAVILAVVLLIIWENAEWVLQYELLTNTARSLRLIYAWMMIASLMGAAQAYLNKPSPSLRYLTTAIFPYYILHQSLIVVAGVWLSGFALPVGLEFTALLLITFGGCWLLYEFIIRRVSFLKPLFGVPKDK